MSMLYKLKDLGHVTVQQMDRRGGNTQGVAEGNLEVCVYLPENNLFIGVPPNFQFFLTKQVRVVSSTSGVYDLPTQDPNIILRLTFVAAAAGGKSSFENIVSQRANIEYIEQPTSGGTFSKLFNKGKAIAKEVAQGVKGALRDTSGFLDEKLSARVPGFVILSPQQIQLVSEPNGAYVYLVAGLGKEVHRIDALAPYQNAAHFTEKALFKRTSEAATCFEVWYKDRSGTDVFQGTAVLRIAELIDAQKLVLSIPIVMNGHMGAITVDAEFIRETVVGSTRNY